MTSEDQAYAGGCRCGAIRYQARGRPIWVAHCHCADCRKSTGAAFATYAGFPTAQVSFTGKRQGFASSPGVARTFCGTCGTPLAYESERWAGEVHILVCTLDDPARLTPKGHVYVAEQLPWVHLADKLPRFAKTPTEGPALS